MSNERKTGQSLKTSPALDLVTAAPEKHICLVDEFLPAIGISMVCGKPKTGKSVLVQNVSFSVAEGLPFLNMTTRCGDVLFLNLEGPVGVLLENLRKLGLTQQRGVIHVSHQSMSFRAEEGLRQLQATLDELPKVVLVVIDPIAKFLRVADSDKYDEVLLALEKLEQIAKKRSLHLMFTTHGKKRQSEDVGDSPIGSTAFRGSTDTNIFLSKRDSRRIISTEQRWGVGMPETVLTFDADRCALSIGATLEAIEEERREDQVHLTRKRIERDMLDALLGRNLETAELLAIVKGKATVKYEVLVSLMDSGRVVSHKDGKKVIYGRQGIPVEAEKEAA